MSTAPASAPVASGIPTSTPPLALHEDTLRILRLDARLTALTARATNDRALRTLLPCATRFHLEPALTRFHTLRQRDAAPPRADPLGPSGDASALRAARRAVKTELRLADHVSSLHAASVSNPSSVTEPDLAFRMRDLEARSRDHRLLHLVAVRTALAALALEPLAPIPCICLDAQVDALRARAHLLWTEPTPRTDVDPAIEHPSSASEPRPGRDRSPSETMSPRQPRVRLVTPPPRSPDLMDNHDDGEGTHHDLQDDQPPTITAGSSPPPAILPADPSPASPLARERTRSPSDPPHSPDLSPQHAAAQTPPSSPRAAQLQVGLPSPEPHRDSDNELEQEADPELEPHDYDRDVLPSHERSPSPDPQENRRAYSAPRRTEDRPTKDGRERRVYSGNRTNGSPTQRQHDAITGTDRRRQSVSRREELGYPPRRHDAAAGKDRRRLPDFDADEHDPRRRRYKDDRALHIRNGSLSPLPLELDSVERARRRAARSASPMARAYNDEPAHGKRTSQPSGYLRDEDKYNHQRYTRSQSRSASHLASSQMSGMSAPRRSFEAATQTPSLPPDVIPNNPFDSPPRLSAPAPAPRKYMRQGGSSAQIPSQTLSSSSSSQFHHGQGHPRPLLPPQRRRPSSSQTMAPAPRPPRIGNGTSHDRPINSAGALPSHQDLMLPMQPRTSFPPYQSSDAYLSGLPSQRQLHAPMASADGTMVQGGSVPGTIPQSVSAYALGHGPGGQAHGAGYPVNAQGVDYGQSVGPGHSLGHGQQLVAGQPLTAAYAASGYTPGAGPAPHPGASQPGAPGNSAMQPNGETAQPGESSGKGGMIGRLKGMMAGATGGESDDDEKGGALIGSGTAQLAQHAVGYMLQHAPGEGKSTVAMRKLGKMVSGNDSDDGRGGAELAQHAMGFVLKNAPVGGKNGKTVQKIGKIVSGDEDGGLGETLAHHAVAFAMKHAPAEAGKAIVANQLGKLVPGSSSKSGNSAAASVGTALATQAIGQLLKPGGGSKSGSNGMVEQIGGLIAGGDGKSSNGMLGTVMNNLAKK